MSVMRVRVVCGGVSPMANGQGDVIAERVWFHPIEPAGAYTAGGLSPEGETVDPTLIRFRPSGELTFQVTNSALFGTFTVGALFDVDFTPVA